MLTSLDLLLATDFLLALATSFLLHLVAILCHPVVATLSNDTLTTIVGLGIHLTALEEAAGSKNIALECATVQHETDAALAEAAYFDEQSNALIEGQVRIIERRLQNESLVVVDAARALQMQSLAQVLQSR